MSKKYSGLGFAEALIALMVTGLVAVVLMRISANAIGELARLDLEDEIARRAVSAAVDIQNAAISESQKDPEDNIFYNTTSTLAADQCYEYEFDADGEISFYHAGDLNDPPISYDRDPISNDPDEEDFFRVVCVIHHESDDRSKMVVKIFTGVVGMVGEHTTGNDIKDYAYYSVINL